jgi:hypothetical protein
MRLPFIEAIRRQLGELHLLAVRSTKKEGIVTHNDILSQQLRTSEDRKRRVLMHPSECRKVSDGSGLEENLP